MLVSLKKNFNLESYIFYFIECLSDEIENIVILIHYNVLSLVTLIPFMKLKF